MVDSQSEVQVSPTVLSSDLFSPAVAEKVTFPFVGVFRRPNHVTVWGTESTKYGGVGKLPSLTQAPSDITQDIVKSRSHRHYSSGLNNYNACSQPYAVTSLSLSGCRTNDQLLLAPCMFKHQQLDEPWPGHAYTSHICRFDVFPRFDPERTKFGASCRRKLKQKETLLASPQKLKPVTQEALEQLSKSIYRTSVYQDTMKEPKHVRNQIEQRLVNRHVRFNREGVRPYEVENWEVSDQEEIERIESNEDDEEETEEDLKNERIKNKDQLENKEVVDDLESSAVWPVWPVGLKNIRKTPLNYPKIPLPTYTPLDFSRRNRLQAVKKDVKQASEEETMQSNPATKPNTKHDVRITRKHIPALTAYNSSILALGDSKHLKFTNPDNKKLNELYRFGVGLVPLKHLAGDDYLNLPLIEQEKPGVQLHEQPGERKHCATGMLGVSFKTDAHKRYHEMYSDVIPDLRDSTITGRQHFFWGINACALR